MSKIFWLKYSAEPYGMLFIRHKNCETWKVLIQDEIIQIAEDIVKLKGLYSSVLASAEVEKGTIPSKS